MFEKSGKLRGHKHARLTTNDEDDDSAGSGNEALPYQPTKDVSYVPDYP